MALLVALFAPALAPSLIALTADSEANLPPCCRSHGAHHCATMHWMLQAPDSGAPKLTSAPCPMYPSALSVSPAGAFAFADMPLAAVSQLQVATLPAATARRAQLVLARTRGDRGPPSSVA